MENLRVSTLQSEIQAVLKSVMTEKRKVLVWQKDDKDEKRRVNYAQINNLNFETRSIGLVPMEDTFDSFTKGLTLYFRSEYSSLLFKSESNVVNKKMIIVPMPREVRLIEKRSESRYKFKKEYIPKVSISKLDKRTNGEIKLNVQLTDISRLGAGLVISSANHRLIRLDQEITLYAIDGKKLPHKITGNIRHITYIKSRSSQFQGAYKVGVEFTEAASLEPILTRISS